MLGVRATGYEQPLLGHTVRAKNTNGPRMLLAWPARRFNCPPVTKDGGHKDEGHVISIPSFLAGALSAGPIDVIDRSIQSPSPGLLRIERVQGCGSPCASCRGG